MKFMETFVDWIVERAVQEAEYWRWESCVEPHPMFADIERDDRMPDYNEFMGSRLGWPKIVTTSNESTWYCPAYSPLKRKRNDEDEYELTLTIRAPKSTKLEPVEVDVESNTAWFYSGENFPRSPYMYQKSLLCKGKQCAGCLQNNC